MTQQEENIKNDYLAGLKYKEIETKNNITHSQLISFIQKNELKRDKKFRSVAQKGNKNAKGNKGGHAPKKNKNSVKTGEFEKIFDTVLDADERKILKGNSQGTKETILQELKLLTIREKRMLNRIQELKNKQRDMTIVKMSKSGDGTSTEIQNTLFLINRIEDGLTRVQESKRRHLDLLYKIECDKGSIVEKPNEVAFKKNTNLLESIGRQLRNRGVQNGK